jgi:hypothetical protein
MQFEIQTRLLSNWPNVKATHARAVANLTAYTTPFPDVGGSLPWGRYQPDLTDMLKVTGSDGRLRGFALFDNTARWSRRNDPMLILEVYADSDETLAAMMKHLTQLARAPGRSHANYVDVGNPNERGRTVLRRLGFNRDTFAYMSGHGTPTPTVRKLVVSPEIEAARENLPGLVAMTSLSKGGLAPGGVPVSEDVERKITGFLSPEGVDEPPARSLSKTGVILKKTGVPTLPEPAPAEDPRRAHGGPGPAAAGAGPPAGGRRRRRTVRRRKSRRQVKSRH